MEPSKEIESLAQDLAGRHRMDPPPLPLLFLGTKCGEAAGIPGPEVIGPLVLQELRQTDPTLAETLLPEAQASDTNAAVDAFLRLLGGMSGIQRYRVLQPFYGSVPVPSFYMDLATLISYGYFSHILTTNWDSLLEQALASVGMRGGADYQTIVLGVPHGTREGSFVEGTPSATIVKLHGDLGQSQFAINEDEIEAAVRSHRSMVVDELRGDMVMVGYEFESPPVERWMAKMGTGDLWWVSSELPDADKLGPIAGNRNFRVISGENAHPQTFFGLLVTFLIRLPATRALSPSLEDWGSSSGMESFGSPERYPTGMRGGSLRTALGDEEVEAEYLQGQLLRSQNVRKILEQALPVGERNPQLDAQIEYQRKQVTELADQVRSLSTSQARLIDLVRQIEGAIQAAAGQTVAPAVDPETISFLTEQVNTVIREAEKGSANQHVLSAALGAVLVVGQRLGREIVTPDLLSELSSYASETT